MNIKKALVMILIGVLCFSMFQFVHFPVSQGEAGYQSKVQGDSTPVSGLISENTTWTLENSPYIVGGDVVVESGAFLTIEPGVVVRFATNTSLVIDGGVNAAGSIVNRIIFTSDALSPVPGSWGTIRTRSGSQYDISNCVVEYATTGIRFEGGSGGTLKELTIANSSEFGIYSNLEFCRITDSVLSKNNIGIEAIGFVAVEINNCTISSNALDGVSIDCAQYSGDTPYNEISNSRIVNNGRWGISFDARLNCNDTVVSNNAGGGIIAYRYASPYVVEARICRSVVSSNNGYGIYCDTINPLYLSSVIVSDNTDCGVYAFGGMDIQYSTISNNGNQGVRRASYGATAGGSIHYSNIFNNGLYDIENNAYATIINATQNWWGTINETQIQEIIHDYYDDYNLGKVLYEPYLTISYGAFALAPTVEWSKRYGGPKVGSEQSVVQTSDGGYAIASTAAFGAGSGADERFWLVKTDSSGNVEWNKTYGEQRVMISSTVQTVDGGYAILGNTVIGGYGIAWLVKTDSAGNMQWNRSYPEIGMQATGFCLVQTSDGGYVIAGCKEFYDGWLMKTDASGAIQWSRSFAEVNTTGLGSVVQTSDGGYIAVGETSAGSDGKVDAYVVKTDSDGNLTWSKEFSRTAGNDYGRSIVQTGDRGYAIAGETDHWGNADFWLIKIDASGSFLWDKTYGGTGWDGAKSIVQTNDEGYALAGQTSSFGAGGNDLWLVKTDIDGNMQWNETYGSMGDDGVGALASDVGSSVVQTVDGGYALAGYTNSFSGDGSYEVWLIKLEESGSHLPTDRIVPDDYPTIQEAINNANEGDTIFVRKGTYYEHIIINQSLTLVGEDRDLTVIDGSGNGEIAYIQADNVCIRNFTLQNAGLEAYGAVWIEGPFSNATICNNTMIDNRHGVAVYLGAQNVTVSDNLIYNTQPSYADGIRLFSSGTIVVGNTVINESTAIGLDWAYNNTIHNNTVIDNYIGIGAGNPSYDNVFSENTISSNSYGFLTAIYDSEFFHNNIINNSVQAAFYSGNYANVWDHGYPSGGNFWSDYEGTDMFSGIYQNAMKGSDNIGDTPYVIDVNNVDHYPLMVQYPPPVESSPPIADFKWSPLTPIANESITFDASLSKNGWNGTQVMPIAKYVWDFGDNNSLTGQTVTHGYSDAGTYSVRLNVTDVQGSWNVTEKQIQIGRPPHNPSAAFTINPEFAHVGQEAILNASSSLPGWNGTHENPITSFVWDFGDGNVTSSQDSTVNHSYAYAGNFNATLTVYDFENMSSSCSHLILVVMLTSVSISTSATSSVIGYVVDINGTLNDIYGNPIGNEPVVLYYTFSGTTSLFPMMSSTTDDNGRYSVQWIPTATGTYCLIAEWIGNLTYYGARSNVTMSCLYAMAQYIFSVESNSTISALAFNTTDLELSFTASGPSGTSGYLKVTIAKSLIANITHVDIHLDNNLIEFSVTSAGNSWVLSFNYSHSSHNVRIDLVSRRIGDITGPGGQLDGICNIIDIGLAASNFGRTVPPAPVNCDLTGSLVGVPDGIINMYDINLIAQHFGQRYQ